MFQELNKRQMQLENAHSMLMRHHDQTRELEMRQQKSVHGLREEHLRRQHDTELTNQVCLIVMTSEVAIIMREHVHGKNAIT